MIIMSEPSTPNPTYLWLAQLETCRSCRHHTYGPGPSDKCTAQQAPSPYLCSLNRQPGQPCGTEAKLYEERPA